MCGWCLFFSFVMNNFIVPAILCMLVRTKTIFNRDMSIEEEVLKFFSWSHILFFKCSTWAMEIFKCLTSKIVLGLLIEYYNGETPFILSTSLFSYIYIYIFWYAIPWMCFTILGCSICFIDFGAWLIFKAFFSVILASR